MPFLLVWASFLNYHCSPRHFCVMFIFRKHLSKIIQSHLILCPNWPASWFQRAIWTGRLWSSGGIATPSHSAIPCNTARISIHLSQTHSIIAWGSVANTDSEGSFCASHPLISYQDMTLIKKTRKQKRNFFLFLSLAKNNNNNNNELITTAKLFISRSDV